MLFPKIIILAAVLANAPGYSHPPDWIRLESTQPRLGTLVKMVIYAKDSLAGKQILADAFEELDRINGILSDYDAESEISRLNESTSLDTVLVSKELMEVLLIARQTYRLTDHAFDPTIKPCVDYWRDLRKTGKKLRFAKVKRLLKKVDFNRVYLDSLQLRVVKPVKELAFDLGGIGKGFIGDRIIAFLHERGYSHALIDLGGDLVAGMAPPGEVGWPIEFGGNGACLIYLVNEALAGSGGTYQYIERRGKRYSHIIDPRTGLGIPAARSAYVLAATGSLADSWASALTVLGQQAKDLDLPVVWQVTDDQLTLASPDFNAYIHCQNE